MTSFNQTVGSDKDTIWVMKIELDSQTFYFSTADDKITLSSIDFDGKVILNDGGISELRKEIDCTRGGTLGQVGFFDFALSRYTNYTGFSDFFDDFFPNNSVYLSGRFVHFGVIWSGATTTSQITWLRKYVIRSHNYNSDFMNLSCEEYSQAYFTTLPPYKVQTQTNDGVSYWPDAPQESVDEAIPIVYGEFNVFTPEASLFRLSSAILVDENRFTFIYACHKVKTDISGSALSPYSQLFKWVESAKSYMELKPDSGDIYNEHYGALISLLSNSKVSGDWVKGKIVVRPKALGKVSDVNDISDLFDSGGFVVVPDTQKLALRLDSSLSEFNMGTLSESANDIKFTLAWGSDSAGTNRRVRLKFYNDHKSGYSGIVSEATTSATSTTTDFGFGATVTNKTYSALPWRLEELNGLDLVAENISGTIGSSGDIEVLNAYLTLDNITIYRVKPEVRKVKVSYPRVKIDLRI